MQLEDWLDDLCVRFIINLPESDLSSVERICFAVEEAQWYYEDFIRPLDPNLPSLNLRNFSLRIFAHCPLLAPFSQSDHRTAFDEFLKYKTRIPVRGAILLNDAMDAAILVKGWKKNANWSFPRGKINKDEDDLTCAMREVYEETGYDIEAAGLVPEDRKVKHIDISMHDQQMALYVFRGVPMDTHFEPKTRKEISKVQWWLLSDLPAYRKKAQQQQTVPASNPNKFYMVAPFLPHLRKWIIEERRKDTIRVSSNQYLSAGVSHDEFLTEEDQGGESSTRDSFYPTKAQPDVDTLEQTNETLRNLLNIRPPTQGLQTKEMVAGQPPVTENRGNALLAFLHGPAPVINQPAPSNLIPHTPLDHISTQAPQPRTPHHQQSRPPHFSSLPPPLTFPIQIPPNSFSYQEPGPLHSRQPGSIHEFQQGQRQNQYQVPRPHENPHSHQSQHLVHPQPLPPHVQRAVFTGGPVHAPMVPQPIQELYPNHLSSTVSSRTSNPQFPNIHAPMVPSAQKKPLPKLTGHSLALLNAFTTRDQANRNAGALSDLPIRRYSEESSQPLPPRPQELPAEVSHPPQANLLAQFGLKQNVTPNTNLKALAPKPTTEAHRTTLLGMFKSPTAQAAVPVRQNAATALPTSTTPSAVELSAVEPLSINFTGASSSVSENKMVKRAGNDQVVPKMNPETNLPFRAMKILARPAPASDSESPGGNVSVPQTQSNGKKTVASRRVQPKSSPEKPFQPQILKRPVSKSSKPPGSPALTGLSTFSALPSHIPVEKAKVGQPNDQKQTLLALLEKPSAAVISPPPPFDQPVSQASSHNQIPLLGKPSPSGAPLLPCLDQRTGQPAEHKQNLLSLFGKAPTATPQLAKTSTEDILSPLFSIDPTMNPSARSRMGSLASGDGASRRASQTPMSSADKEFLLGYLGSVTKGSQR